ncbi:MAG: hypothetical protein ACU0DB_12225 [Paracoccus sp. (in: a-proteobacteria)]|uniref:hypothetical protein n=1 Tax=Paracoccus sp. TaxID=267 RepID=UPI000C5123F4|nr:hypothetical protein [Paracoccus sp. (in: a-proteobacteria)]
METRPFALATLLLLLPLPAPAQAPYQPPPADAPRRSQDAEDPTDRIGRGLGMLFQDLWNDVGPDLNRLGEDMSGALSRMAPVLKDLAVLVDDLGNYETPRRLENGDIVIRRKPGAPPPPPIGENLRDFPDPDAPGADQSPDQSPDGPSVPRDPDAPEIEL